MKEIIEAWSHVDRNRVAFLLSVVPGAGHLYKHHYGAGLTILIAGNLLVVFCALLLALATAGVSLVAVPVIWWVSVAFAAYGLEDWHGKHQWLHPWTDRGEVPVEAKNPE